MKRVLKWPLLLALFAILVLYLLLPAGIGIAALLPAGETVGAPPPGFESVSLTTKSGISLAGWYTQPRNGAAIILIHGTGDSRENTRSYAEMLVRHGYGVLALDLQGHGMSEGATNRFGWRSGEDVAAAVSYLQDRREVEYIGGLGLSLGGESLLGAASDAPALAAIVADGATLRCVDELLALPSERPLAHNFFSRVQFATVHLLSGDEPPRPLLDSMVAAGSTHYLLIAGGRVKREVAYNELFAETVGERATLWVATDAVHTGAFALYPEEYEQRVIAFFADTLLDGSVTR